MKEITRKTRRAEERRRERESTAAASRKAFVDKGENMKKVRAKSPTRKPKVGPRTRRRGARPDLQKLNPMECPKDVYNQAIDHARLISQHKKRPVNFTVTNKSAHINVCLSTDVPDLHVALCVMIPSQKPFEKRPWVSIGPKVQKKAKWSSDS